MSSSEQGASSLLGMVHDGGYASALDNPSSFFGGSSTQKMMGIGQQLRDPALAVLQSLQR
jgi:hypothetical protein